MEGSTPVNADVQMIMEAFRQLDHSGDGTMPKEDVCNVLHQVDAERWTNDKVGELFNAFGAKEASVNVEAFVTWLFSDAPPASAGSASARPNITPHATHQFSSTIVEMNAQGVYELIRPLTFKWLSTVASARQDEDSNEVFHVAYSDNTVQTIQLTEYSDLDLKVGWEVVASDPPTHCVSQVHTLRCLRITDTNSCCLTWNTEFSADATLDVIHDCKWKKEDAFESLKRMCPAGERRY